MEIFIYIIVLRNSTRASHPEERLNMLGEGIDPINGAPTVGYGVPKATRGAATRGGGPVHNDGVVWSRLRRPAGEPAGDARDGDVFLAAAVAHTRAQDLDVAVSVEECSRREWNRQFRVPCEDLWHLDMF